MYKEFVNSTKIDYEDIIKQDKKSEVFSKKFIFVYDEDNTRDLIVYCRHLNGDFTCDSYEMGFDEKFALLSKGKEYFGIPEVLGRLREKSSWTFSWFTDNKNFV